MAATTRSGMVMDLGVVVHSAYDDEGWIGVRVDGFGGDDSGLGDSELQTPFGFTSRPVDRAKNGIGCEVLYAHSGNSESFAWFGKDPRYTDKCPPLFQGSSAQWASNGSFGLLDTESNSYKLYVPRGSSAHSVTVGQADDGVDLIEFRHSSGALLYCTPETGWVMRGVGNAFAGIDGDAFNVNGNATVTGALTVGGTAGQPVINATLAIAALNALGSAISMGGSAPVVASAMGAAFTALAAALGACQTASLKAI
jgi:hypothetical protein